MKDTKVLRTRRMSSEERREDIVDAAVAEFAVKGLHGTSTETIARRAGVSQPYLFRLFGTKRDLFLAAVHRGFDRVEDVFRAAVVNTEEPLVSMGAAYIQLLADRKQLLLQMHAYAACSDPEVKHVVRDRYRKLFDLVQELSGSSDDQVRDFFAHGMFLNVAAAMDLPALVASQEWARRTLGLE